MALRARDRGMFPRQRISGLLVIHGRRLEARIIVAAAAIVLELALMGILRVAIPTGGVRDLLHLAGPMALRALEPDVFPPERVLALIMVVGGDLPGRLGVALRAGFSQGWGVRVAVAVETGGVGQAFPLLLGVAFFAGDVPMRSLQGIGRGGVIELDLLERDIDRVARVAVLGELPFVDVFMTEPAPGALDEVGPFPLARRGIAGVVALVAIGDPRMLSLKVVAGLGVIERARLPVDELEIRPLMVRMAGWAAGLLVPVKAPPCDDPGRQLFVAGQALLVDRSIPGRMALRAVVQAGQFAVSLAELARRNQQFRFLAPKDCR